MSKMYICNSQKFEFSSGGYVGMPMEVDGLPQSLSIEGQILQRKSEFHVTLLSVKSIVAEHGDVEQKILDLFCNFVKENDILFVSYTGEFRVAKTDENKTVVAMCEVSNVHVFSDLLEKVLGIEIPKQPTHVTLYALPPDVRGIALSSPKDLEQMTHVIEVPSTVKTALCLT
ncbi:MAG: hypothetical protein ACI9VM_000113 [Candidatus Azotimanducaceae bacterium]|jgi:hypothetical protein